MRCPKCGSETHYFDNIMIACDKCDWIRHWKEVISTLSKFKNSIEDIWSDGEYFDNARATIKLIDETKTR